MQCRRHAGFTLIEVLVVLVILSVLGGMAVISLPRRTPPADAALPALAARLLRAEDQAVLAGSRLGLVIGTDGYRLVERQRDGHWRQPADAALAGEHRLTPPLQVRVGDERLPLRSARRRAGEAPPLQVDDIGHWPALSIADGSGGLLRGGAGQRFTVSRADTAAARSER